MEKYIVDILLIAVVVLSAVVAAKKGFFLTLMSIVSAVAALIGSKVLATPIAEFLYSSFVRNPVLTKVQAMLPESLAGNDPQAVLDGLLGQLPSGVVSLADSYGILDGAKQFTGDAVAFFNIDNLEVNYIKPFCITAISLLATVVVFYVLFVVLRLFCKLLNTLIYKNKKQPVNRFLGAALGVVRAVIPVAIATVLLNFAADYNVNDTLTVAVENSKICAWVETASADLFADVQQQTLAQSQNNT